MADQIPGQPTYADKHGPVVDAEKAFLGVKPEEPVFGLALSGGGIRSASFALGLLQALHGYEVFEKFHYFSTVSGGGYIGSALTYFRNVFQFPDPTKPGQNLNWFPFGYLRGSNVRAIGARTEKPADAPSLRAYEIVSFLRQHASFLTPSRQLDRPAMAAGVLRGLVGCVLPYMAMLSGLFGVALAWRLFDPQLGLDGIHNVSVFDAYADRNAPAFYLALLPAAVAIVLLLVTLLSSLCQVLITSKASAGREDPVKAQAGYRNSIAKMSFYGNVLVWCAGLLLLSTLPWLHDYLSGLKSGGALPTTTTALLAALGGGAAQVAKLRSIVGGNQSPPSIWKSLLMLLAGIAFVFGVVLLAYVAGFYVAYAADQLLLPRFTGVDAQAKTLILTAELAEAALLGAIPLLVALIGLLLAYKINVNHASQHRIYRDRLMEVFCAEERALKQGQWYPAEKAQGQDGWLMNMVKVKKPYHLISTALITTDSNDRKYRGRGGDNFLLSPLYCGSDATGWAKTGDCMPAMSIATAAAVSGAALNAHAGPHGSGGLRNKAYAALLSFLGLNLGYWARNPKKLAPGEKPKFPMPNLMRPGLANISGRNLNEAGNYVQLSDGGHFENLAVYELIRRNVAFMWVSDAGQDEGFTFEDLSSAIERVRVDFGVNVRFREEPYDLTHLLPDTADTPTDASKIFAKEYSLAKRGYAIGTIEYPTGPHGIIVYVKTTLTRGLPGDLYGYKARNKDFPHQTTLDQFFDEQQFEAYRELGYRLVAQLFRDIEDARKDANTTGGPTQSPALDRVAAALGI
jgi:hypothetical protein